MTAKIAQLIPADSWYALYWTSSPLYFALRRLVAFALVETEDGDRRIDAIDQDEHLAKLRDHFEGYFHESEINEDFKSRYREIGQAMASRN